MKKILLAFVGTSLFLSSCINGGGVHETTTNVYTMSGQQVIVVVIATGIAAFLGSYFGASKNKEE